MSNISELPFVRVAEDGTKDLWVVRSTGDYDGDNKLGASYAEACLEHMRETDFPGLLNHIIAAMAKATGGNHGGIEVGFLHRITCRAMVV